MKPLFLAGVVLMGVSSDSHENPSFCQVMTQVNSGGGMAEERKKEIWSNEKIRAPGCRQGT